MVLPAQYPNVLRGSDAHRLLPRPTPQYRTKVDRVAILRRTFDLVARTTSCGTSPLPTAPPAPATNTRLLSESPLGRRDSARSTIARISVHRVTSTPSLLVRLRAPFRSRMRRRSP